MAGLALAMPMSSPALAQSLGASCESINESSEWANMTADQPRCDKDQGVFGEFTNLAAYVYVDSVHLKMSMTPERNEQNNVGGDGHSSTVFYHQSSSDSGTASNPGVPGTVFDIRVFKRTVNIDNACSFGSSPYCTDYNIRGYSNWTEVSTAWSDSYSGKLNSGTGHNISSTVKLALNGQGDQVRTEVYYIGLPKLEFTDHMEASERNKWVQYKVDLVQRTSSNGNAAVFRNSSAVTGIFRTLPENGNIGGPDTYETKTLWRYVNHKWKKISTHYIGHKTWVSNYNPWYSEFDPPEHRNGRETMIVYPNGGGGV